MSFIMRDDTICVYFMIKGMFMHLTVDPGMSQIVPLLCIITLICMGVPVVRT